MTEPSPEPSTSHTTSNGRTSTIRPEVATFVAAVREHLADLTEDEREELLGGLEADLSDQLDEGTTGGLPDPTQYAAELRAAAGLPERRHGRFEVPSSDAVARGLDTAGTRWRALVAEQPWSQKAWDLVVALRPAWWVLRAWLAVTLLDRAVGPAEPVAVLPGMAVPGLGFLVLVAAVVVSALIGLGRLWPRGGPGQPLSGRLVLLALNAFAVSLLLPTLSSAANDNGYGVDYAVDANGPFGQRAQGLRSDGRAVTNVFAYDAAGQPLAGVQLFDQDGNPLDVTARQSATGRRGERSVGCPAFNGTSPLFNVFPLEQRLQRRGTCLDDQADAGAATAATPPLAQVPPVTTPALPGDATTPEGLVPTEGVAPTEAPTQE